MLTHCVSAAFSLARHNRYADLLDIMECEDPYFHPDTADSKGNSILLVACQNGLKRIVKLALKVGCDINHQNGSGNTALHFCYMYGFGDTLGKYIAEKGGDDTVLNYKQLSCYDVTMRPGAAESGAATPDGDSLMSPSSMMSPMSPGLETYEEEEEEVLAFDGVVEFVDDQYNYRQQQQQEEANWESDYLEQYVDGGYESNECWGETADHDESADSPVDSSYDYKSDQPYEIEYGEDGSYHYNDDDGRACFCNKKGAQFYWDAANETWAEIAPVAESKSESKEEEEEEAPSEKEEAESVARPHGHLYKTFKVSTTKRKPPPKPNSKRPPPLAIPKRAPPTSPNPKAPPRAPPKSPHKDHVDDPQMLLMEAVASRNHKHLTSLLQNPLITVRDVHAALLNATTKGAVRIVTTLLPKASSQSANSCLTLASKVSNVDVIKALLPRCTPSGIVRGMVTLASTGQIHLLPVFFGEKEVGGDGGFGKHEAQRIVLACVSKNMYAALNKLIPYLKVEGMEQVYARALTQALVKNNLEVAGVLVEHVSVDNLSTALAVAARNGNSSGAKTVLGGFYKIHEGVSAEEWETQRDFFIATLRHCVEITTSKGMDEVREMLEKEMAKAGEIGGAGKHSAADLMGKKKSLQDLKQRR